MATGQQVGICVYVKEREASMDEVCVHDSLCGSECVSESENWISLVTVWEEMNVCVYVRMCVCGSECVQRTAPKCAEGLQFYFHAHTQTHINAITYTLTHSDNN